MQTTHNQVVFEINEVNVTAHISTRIEGELVSATLVRPRSMELSQGELIEELQDLVWWKKLA